MKTRPISIKEAAEMMERPEQFVRKSIRGGNIPGAYFLKGESGMRGTYYVTNTQVKRMMEGEK